MVADLYPNFSICGIPYHVSGDVPDWRALAHRSVAELEAAGIRLLLDTTATDIDTGARGRLIRDRLTEAGVDVFTDTAVHRVGHHAGRLRVRGDRGFDRSTDLVLVVVGVRPDTKLASTAGLRLGAHGAIEVDRWMRTGVPHVWAAGDCVVTHDRLLGTSYLPLGTTAHKQGRVAGENAIGGNREFAGVLGAQVVKVFDLAAARTGLRDVHARDAGFSPWSVDSEADDHKAYYPGARSIRMRVTADAGTGRLLGMQMVGHKDAAVAKRIDIAAAAIHHGMTVGELADLDLSYTPPLGSPWDAVQMAAQTWERQLRSSVATTR